MIGRTNLGGGNSLTYRVFGGTSAPTDPKEGDIWVNTSVAITHVEFGNPWSGALVGSVVIQGTVGGVEPASNNTVINVFRAKVGGIVNREKLTPSGVKQVQGSAGNWVSRDAYVRHGSTWVKFSSSRLYLFSANNMHNAVTGGWSSNGYSQGPGSPGGGGGFDGPSIYCTASQYHYEGANGTGLKIDMRNYRTLYANCISTSTTNAYIYVSSDKNNFGSNAFSAAVIPKTRSVIAVDVSYVAEGYVVFTSHAADNGTSRVYEMWLE